MDLIKLTLVKLGYGGSLFRIEPIFAIATSVSKYDSCFKSGQK